MIDVILAEMLAVLFHPKQVIDYFDEVARVKKRVFDAVLFGTAHLDVELETSDTRKIEAAWVEKHAFKQMICGRNSRRIARTHFAIDLKQCIDRLCYRVLFQGLRDHFADNVILREEDLKALDAFFDDLLQFGGQYFGIRFDYHLAGFGVDNVGQSICAFEIVR